MTENDVKRIVLETLNSVLSGNWRNLNNDPHRSYDDDIAFVDYEETRTAIVKALEELDQS